MIRAVLETHDRLRIQRGAVWLLTPAICIGALRLPAQSDPFPRFAVSLEGCPETLSLPFGTPWERELGIQLTTSENTSDQGAQGWSLSVSVTGVEPLSVTTQGTVAARETDDPPGFMKPAPDGFLRAWVGSCGDTKGVGSAIVLSLTEVAYLPPTGPALILRVTVGGVAPVQPDEFISARLEFRDGCFPGPGSPHNNVITWRGNTTLPELGPACEFFVDGFPAPRFLRGDANDDGEVDISDSLFILGCKFLGTGCPGCRDAGDLNDSGDMDISDAVHGLNFLFSGGPPPPHPGPETCGSDPTPDVLPDCSYSRC